MLKEILKTKSSKGSKSWPFWLLTAVIVFSLFLAGGTAQAVSGLVLSTPYPGVAVEPGERITFPLEIRNTGAGKVVLSVDSKPDGWEATIEGNGRRVHQVFAGGDYNPNVNLGIQLPAEVEEGDYQLVVSARGGGRVSSLTLDMRVTKDKVKGGELVTRYPELQGPSGATFQFRVDLTNNTSKEQSYSLGAKVAPGWQVNFNPANDSKQIASLSLEAGRSQGLDVSIIPPKNVMAGKYTIPIAAVSASSTAQTDLQVIITGTYELTLTTPSGRLNAQAVAGKETGLSLEVENNGSSDLENITLSSREPAGWSVTFEPEQIEKIAPGESRQVTAKIKPDAKAIAGDYVVNLTASTKEADGKAQIRVLVKTSTLWGLTGLAIILAVIAGVGAAFRYYGRR